MGIYYKHFMNIMRHKADVFKKCWVNGLRREAITHDISKLLPSEFFPYAKWLYGNRGRRIADVVDKLDDKVQKEFEMTRKNFDIAVKKHYNRNKHHWNHWTGRRFNQTMTDRALNELLYDWQSVGERNGNTPQKYYLENYFQINLSNKNRWRLEEKLGLKMSLNAHTDPYYEMTIQQIYAEVVVGSPELSYEQALKIFNNVVRDVNNKYNLDVHDLLLESKSKTALVNIQ